MQSEVYVLDNPRRRHYGHYRRHNPDGFVSEGVELAKDAALTAGGFAAAGVLSRWFPSMIKSNAIFDAVAHVGLALATLSGRRMLPGGTRVAVDLANGMVLRGLLNWLGKSGLSLPGGRYLPSVPAGIGGGGRVPFPRVAQRYAMPAPVASPVMPAQKPPVNFR